MEFHQIRYFLAVAETGNFTRAAEQCFVSQPSLSAQILKLEDELGHPLFHRMGRKAVLTDTGELFLERARRIAIEMENAVREIRDDPDKAERTVKVGAIPTVAPYLLPPLLHRCAREYPNLEITTHEDFRHALLKEIQEGNLDLAVMSLPVQDRQLQVEVFREEPLLLLLSKKHRLAEQQKIRLADLKQENFILLGNASSLVMQIRRFCGDEDFEPRIGDRCTQVATLKRLVSLNLGVSILPSIARMPDDADDVVYREISGRFPRRQIGLVRHRHRYESSGVRDLLKLVREEFANVKE